MNRKFFNFKKSTRVMLARNAKSTKIRKCNVLVADVGFTLLNSPAKNYVTFY